MANEQDFGIRIGTTADLTSLRETISQLENAKAAAERMGVSTAGAAAEINALKKQLSRAGEETGKATEEVEKLELGHHELKKAAHELAGIAGLGELAGVLHGMFSPEAAGMFAFITALDFAKKSIDEFAEKVSEALAKVRELNEALSTAHREAIAEAHAAQTAFAQSLQETAKNEDAVTQAAERSIAILKEQSKQTESLVDLNLKLAEALLAQKAARGQITKTQQDQQTQQLEHQAQIERDRAEDQQAADEIAARRRQLGGVIGERDTAEGKLPGARADAALFSDDAKRAQAAISEFEEALKTAKAKQDEDAKSVAKWTALMATGVPGAQTGFDQATDALAESTGARQIAQDRLEAAQNIVSLAQEEADKRKKLVAALEEETKARADLADQLRQQIHDMAADNGRRIAQRGQREAVAQRTQDVQNQTALEQRIRDGTASAADMAEYSASIERGPQASIDASQAVRDARIFMQSIRGHAPNQSERAQLDIFAAEVIGFLHDTFADLSSQRSNLQRSLREIDNMKMARHSNNGFQN